MDGLVDARWQGKTGGGGETARVSFQNVLQMVQVGNEGGMCFLGCYYVFAWPRFDTWI